MDLHTEPMPLSPEELTERLRERAFELGFDQFGVAPAEHADPENRLGAWLQQGFAAGMGYMHQNQADRQDPRVRMPEARSVIALTTSYHHPRPPSESPLKVARYCQGADYHRVLKRRLQKLRKSLLSWVPEAKAYPTVDTSPVMESVWAERAGLVWIGKSTLAISKTYGSYTFLSTLTTDVDLTITAHRLPDGCKSCTRCLDACPTHALVAPYQLDASRCISYWTLERPELSLNQAPPTHGWVAGCDICQEVCPYNRRTQSSREARFLPRDSLAAIDPALFLDASREAELTAAIQGTAIQRNGPEKLRENARKAMESPVQRSSSASERGDKRSRKPPLAATGARACAAD